MNSQLMNADSVLEKAQEKNKSLNDDLIRITKEKDKLENKLQSHLNSRKIEAMKVNEYVAENQGLKDEVSMLRKSLEGVNKSHFEKCKEVKTLMDQSEALKAEKRELQKRIVSLEQERESYRRTAEELRKVHKGFLASLGNESNFKKQLEEVKSIVDESKRSLILLKDSASEVLQL